MNLCTTVPQHFHISPGMFARRLRSLPALLLVAGGLLLVLLSQAAAVLADESSDVCYVTNWSSQDVRAYTLEADGKLVPKQDPVKAKADEQPRRILLSPDQRFAYVIAQTARNSDVSVLLAYDIDQGGNLTSRPAGRIIQPTIWNKDGASGAMAFHSTGHELYIPEHWCYPTCTKYNSWISVYDVDPDGFVSRNISKKQDSNPVPLSVDVNPNGKNFYVATQESWVCIYNTDESTGEVTDPGCVKVGALASTERIRVDPSGTYVWVTNSGGGGRPGSFTAFSITLSGLLKEITEVPVKDGTPWEIAFNSSGTYGAVLDFQGRLLLYRISPTTGEPLLQASAPTWPLPFAVTFAAQDKFILVPSYDKNVVSTYDFDESTGQVTWRVDSPVGTKPTSIACTAGPQIPSFTLTITKAGGGSGRVTSDPAGIDCSPTCQASFQSGQSVRLTATPDDANSTFVGWSGDPDCAAGVVTMTADKTCTATFLGIWSIGTLLEITWKPSWFSSERVKIELSRDGGITWKTIFAPTQNDGKQMWRITGPATQQARIKVCNSDASSFCAFTADSVIQ